MILSSLKSAFHQLLLWEEPLRGMGHVRTVIGQLAEELTAERVGGRIHRTDSRCDYCPDVSTDCPVRYFECKAVGCSRTAFIYEGRLNKDDYFWRSTLKPDIYYSIWHHGADTSLAVTVEQLRDLVLENLRAYYLVPFRDLWIVCQGLKVEKLNSAYGGALDRPEYGSGYRIHLRLLKRFLVERF